MDFLVFSDLHAHKFPYAATEVPIDGFRGLYNSRLRDTVAVLDEILAYAVRYDIKLVLFGGDLFHRRTSVDTDVRSVVVDRLRKFGEEGIYLTMIPGNHDFGNKKGFVHNLYGLENEWTDVLSSVGWVSHDCISYDDLNVICVPYTADAQEAREWLKEAGELADKFMVDYEQPSILLAHLGMQGAKVGSDYVLMSASDVQVDDVPYDKFAACFFGHFHEHQQLFKNGWFIGATHQHNWGDVGGKRGFLHCTIDEEGDVTFKRVETSAPKFVVVTDDNVDDVEVRECDFVKYFSNSKTVPEKLQEVHHLDQLPVEEDELDVSVDLNSLDPAGMVEAWVKANQIPEEEEKEYIEWGLKLLNEVS